MPRHAALLALATSVGLVTALAPRRAHADQKEWTIAVTPAYAVAYVDSRTGSGGGGGVDVGYGITESLSFVLGLRALSLVAMAFYTLAFIAGFRRRVG